MHLFRLQIGFIAFSSLFLFNTTSAAAATAAAQAAPSGGYISDVIPASAPGQIIQSPAVQNPVVDSKQVLKEAEQVLRTGDADQAFTKSLTAKNLNAVNPLDNVQYLNTLLKIAEKSEGESRQKVVTEALATINALATNPNYDGRSNPESAYYFMVAAGDWAEIASTVDLESESIFQIRLAQGNIARNLRNNPMYPKDSLESLSGALIGLAKGYALKGDQAAATQAISEAADLGFGEFETLADDESLNKLNDQKALKTHIATLEKSYQVKLEQWGQQEIEKFESFSFNFNVDDVEGGELDNNEFGDKILVVDFWATWCAPCREGIPHFVKLQEEFENEDVQVLGVSMDSPDDPQSSTGSVRRFLKANKVNYPCGMGTDRLAQRLPGEVKLPTTLFMDRMGNVRYIANGYHNHAKLAAITKALASEAKEVRTSVRTRVRNVMNSH